MPTETLKSGPTSVVRFIRLLRSFAARGATG